MGVRRLGIIMNGVTGRMGTNQHLVRSIVAIRAQGGVALGNGDHVVPDPILVGRNKEKLALLAEANGIARITTDLDAALADANDTVFFDAGTTQMRPALLDKAIAAGKHVYCEKPVATTVDAALGIVRKAKAAGIRHGVVQDKLFLPGLRKLKLLIDSGFFGRIFAVRGEFGYWVFCLGATHIPERIDEKGARYMATADDAAYATFQLEGGIIAHFNSSWATN